jgi:hypothetical protein
MPLEDLTDAIRENAGGPKQVSTDGLTVSQHSLKDQIDALNHLREADISKSRKLPVRIARIRPGGALG